MGRFERQNNPGYWSLRRWFTFKLLRVRERIFNTRAGAENVKYKAGILGGLVGELKYQLAGAVLLAAGLFALDYLLIAVTPSTWHPKLEQDPQLALLSTLAQVSATMLGLYFTAVSVVASTAYARVPGEVRALIVTEEAGTLYFGFLSRFCLLSILWLIAGALGWRIGFLGLGVLALFTLFGVVSFISLGLRTFSFFDPSSLVESLNRPLRRCFADVTPRGFAWDEPAFQDLHHRQARHRLICYESLVLVAEQKENLHTRSLLVLGYGLLEVLEVYPVFKAQIPSKSHWFQRRYRHKDWLATSYSEVEIARATNTALQPDEVPDPTWLERDAGRLLARILRSLLERDELAAANSLLTRVHGLLGQWGYYHQLPEALALVTNLQEAVRTHFRTAKFTPAPPAELEKSARRLELFDLASQGLMNILLGWAEHCRGQAPEPSVETVHAVRWDKASSLYPTGIRPRPVIEQWEALHGKIQFELAVEGRLVSPAWLLTEAAALGYCRYYAGVADLVAAHEHWFKDALKERIVAGDPIGGAHLGVRALEAVNKLQAHLPMLADWHARCAALNRSNDEPWPEIDWKKLEARAEQLRKDVTDELVGLIGPVLALPDEKNLPDLFGQIYTVLAERCVEALVEEDVDTFRKLFPKVFMMGLGAYQRVVSRSESHPQHAFRLAMGPLGDLLALSGYALVSGDLAKPEFAQIARDVWEKYLASRTDDAQRRSVITQFASSTDVMMGFSPRAMLRFEWQRTYNAYLGTKGFKTGDGFFFGETPRPVHPSPLVRCFVVRTGMYDADDVFVAVYLKQRPEAKGIKLPAKAESFAQSLDRETRRKTGETPEDGDDE